MTSFSLKIIAIIGMTANHAAHLLGSFMPIQLTAAIYSLGGVTFATMAFLVVEGYLHTSNVKKYASRLLVFALVSQPPFALAFGHYDAAFESLYAGDFLWAIWLFVTGSKANVMVTLFLGLMLLVTWDKLGAGAAGAGAGAAGAGAAGAGAGAAGAGAGAGAQYTPTPARRALFIPILAAITGISWFCDWQIVGPVMVWLFYVLRKRGTLGVITTLLVPTTFFICTTIPALIENLEKSKIRAGRLIQSGLENTEPLFYVLGVPLVMTNPLWGHLAVFGYVFIGFTIATICISHYNGQRGRPMKWFFYAYYPAHLLVLWGIAQILERL